MTKGKLNIGVIGCGRMGNIYCKLIKSLSVSWGTSRINFAGIFDIDENTGKRVAKEYNVRKFNTYEALINDIDVLFIVTPTSTHFDIAKVAISNGLNLFIEKPVTEKSDEAKQLIELSKDSKVKVQVGHVERFNPAVVSLAKYDLKPMFIEAHRLAQFNPRGTDVTVIHDLMIHDIDIILSFVKSPVERVDANGVAVISDSIDIANARIKFQNGCVANLTSSRISLKKMRKMRIFQPNSYITLDFLANKAEIFRLAEGKESDRSSHVIPISEGKNLILEETSGNDDDNPIRNEIESFVDSIINNKPVKVTLEDAQRALEVSDKIVKIISGET